MSHNFVHKFCILGLQLCNKVASRPEFMVQQYVTDKPACIEWRSIEEYDNYTAMSYERTLSFGDMFVVARLENEN